MNMNNDQLLDFASRIVAYNSFCNAYVCPFATMNVNGTIWDVKGIEYEIVKAHAEHALLRPQSARIVQTYVIKTDILLNRIATYSHNYKRTDPGKLAGHRFHNAWAKEVTEFFIGDYKEYYRRMLFLKLTPDGFYFNFKPPVEIAHYVTSTMLSSIVDEEIFVVIPYTLCFLEKAASLKQRHEALTSFSNIHIGKLVYRIFVTIIGNYMIATLVNVAKHSAIEFRKYLENCGLFTDFSMFELGQTADVLGFKYIVGETIPREDVDITKHLFSQRKEMFSDIHDKIIKRAKALFFLLNNEIPSIQSMLINPSFRDAYEHLG